MPMRAATVVQSLAGLVSNFIACFILLVIAPLSPSALLTARLQRQFDTPSLSVAVKTRSRHYLQF